jgi:L1 cell adhesion molecule like protein
MVQDAEKFKEDDEKAKEIIDAKNNYENFVFQMKSTLNDEKMNTLIDENMKEEFNKILEEHGSWLENNQMASKDEYDGRKKELEEAMKPLQEKMMAGMQGMGGMPDMSQMPKSEPSSETTHGTPKVVDIDDVD